MFPVMFLILLGVIVNGQTIHAQGGIDATTYFVPAVITLAVVSATMVRPGDEPDDPAAREGS